MAQEASRAFDAFPCADGTAYRVDVSTPAEPLSPAKLCGVAMVADEDATSVMTMPVGRLVLDCISIPDSGSATTLAGKTDAEEWLRNGLATRVDPRPSSVRHIRGIGAITRVCLWIKFTLDMGGALVTFHDVPVLSGHRGLLLGNDFLGPGRADLSYESDRSGVMVIRDKQLVPQSLPIPFDISGSDGRSFVADSAAAACDFGNITATEREELSALQDKAAEVEKALSGVDPIGWVPETTSVPAWCEKDIWLRVPELLVKARDVLLLPLEDERRTDPGVMIAPSLQRVDKDGYVRCWVINMQKKEVRLPLLTPLVRFQIDPRVFNIDYEYTPEEIIEKINVGTALSPPEKEKVLKMVSTRRALFRSTLGYAHPYKMKLKLRGIAEGLAKAPNATLRLRSTVESDALREETQKQLKAGLIEPAHSPFNAVPMLVEKPTKEGQPKAFRVVLDFRAVNLLLEKDVYPLPNLESNLARLGKANWFTTCDLLSGFHQVELADDGSKEATAFSTPDGQFQYVRMPMGLASSPSTFMRLVDATLHGLPPGICLAYVDDIIIPTCGSFDDHMRDVGIVFDRLIESGFAVRCDKVYVGLREISYLGFMVGAYGTRPLPEKTQAIFDMTIADMWGNPVAAARYAGMLGFYSRFIPDLRHLLTPYDDLKAKSARVDHIIGKKGVVSTPPSLRFLASFAATRAALTNVVALARPDLNKPFEIHVDAASSCGIGGALMQRQDPDDPDSLIPIAFWSRRLQDEERGYDVREQECLGLDQTLKKWRHYLLGAVVHLLTDHSSLQWLLTTPHPDGSRVAAWALNAQGYDVKISYISGTKNIVADCISRMAKSDAPVLESGATGEKERSIVERLEEAAADEISAVDTDMEAEVATLALTTRSVARACTLQHHWADLVTRLIRRARSVEEPVSSSVCCTQLVLASSSDGNNTSITNTFLGEVGGTCERDLQAAESAVTFVHKSERVAIALLQYDERGELKVAIEQCEGELLLPSAAVADTDTLCYRGQISRMMGNMGIPASVTRMLPRATPFKSRRTSTVPRCHFFLLPVPSDLTFHTSTIRFESLTESLLSSLLESGDAAFLRLVSRELGGISDVRVERHLRFWVGSFKRVHLQLKAVHGQSSPSPPPSPPGCAVQGDSQPVLPTESYGCMERLLSSSLLSRWVQPFCNGISKFSSLASFISPPSPSPPMSYPPKLDDLLAQLDDTHESMHPTAVAHKAASPGVFRSPFAQQLRAFVARFLRKVFARTRRVTLRLRGGTHLEHLDPDLQECIMHSLFDICPTSAMRLAATCETFRQIARRISGMVMRARFATETKFLPCRGAAVAHYKNGVLSQTVYVWRGRYLVPQHNEAHHCAHEASWFLNAFEHRKRKVLGISPVSTFGNNRHTLMILRATLGLSLHPGYGDYSAHWHMQRFDIMQGVVEARALMFDVDRTEHASWLYHIWMNDEHLGAIHEAVVQRQIGVVLPLFFRFKHSLHYDYPQWTMLKFKVLAQCHLVGVPVTPTAPLGLQLCFKDFCILRLACFTIQERDEEGFRLEFQSSSDADGDEDRFIPDDEDDGGPLLENNDPQQGENIVTDPHDAHVSAPPSPPSTPPLTLIQPPVEQVSSGLSSLVFEFLSDLASWAGLRRGPSEEEPPSPPPSPTPLSRKRPQVSSNPGRSCGRATTRQRGLVDQLLEHRAWISQVLNQSEGASDHEARLLRGSLLPLEQSFCRAIWAPHFNKGRSIADTRFRTIDEHDCTEALVVGIIDKLSLSLASSLSEARVAGFEPRCAEGFQFSYGGGRGFHIDDGNLGRLILTVTLCGDGTIEVEDVDSPCPRSHSRFPPWSRIQSQYDYYAIWGRSREKEYGVRHRVLAGSQPRLSLTLRYEVASVDDPVRALTTSQPDDSNGSAARRRRVEARRELSSRCPVLPSPPPSPSASRGSGARASPLALVDREFTLPPLHYAPVNCYPSTPSYFTGQETILVNPLPAFAYNEASPGLTVPFSFTELFDDGSDLVQLSVSNLSSHTITVPRHTPIAVLKEVTLPSLPSPPPSPADPNLPCLSNIGLEPLSIVAQTVFMERPLSGFALRAVDWESHGRVAEVRAFVIRVWLGPSLEYFACSSLGHTVVRGEDRSLREQTHTWTGRRRVTLSDTPSSFHSKTFSPNRLSYPASCAGTGFSAYEDTALDILLVRIALGFHDEFTDQGPDLGMSEPSLLMVREDRGSYSANGPALWCADFDWKAGLEGPLPFGFSSYPHRAAFGVTAINPYSLRHRVRVNDDEAKSIYLAASSYQYGAVLPLTYSFQLTHRTCQLMFTVETRVRLSRGPPIPQAYVGNRFTDVQTHFIDVVVVKVERLRRRRSSQAAASVSSIPSYSEASSSDSVESFYSESNGSFVGFSISDPLPSPPASEVPVLSESDLIRLREAEAEEAARSLNRAGPTDNGSDQSITVGETTVLVTAETEAPTTPVIGEGLPLPAISNHPCGPAFCGTPADGRQALELIGNRLRHNLGLSLSADLEGMLGGRRGHIDLMQLAVDATTDQEEQLIFVFDTDKHGNAFLGQGPLRDILEDSRIPKVLHCSYGDCSALFYEYGIEIKGVFDTGLADCLLRGVGAHQQRRLDKVIEEYVPGTTLAFKSTFQHTPGMFAIRPLPYHYFVYSYEDVKYCNQLFVAMRDALEKQGLLELARVLSDQRAPPYALPAADVRYKPPTSIVVVLRDAQHVICLRTGEAISLPTGSFSGTLDEVRARAMVVLEDSFGSLTTTGIRKVINNRLKKAVRVGQFYFVEAILNECHLLLPSLQEANSLQSVILHPIQGASLASVASEQLPLFQFIRSHGPRVKPLASYVVVGKTLTSQRAALIVHDTDCVFCLTTAREGELAFPSAPIELGLTARESAIRAFNTYAGPSLYKNSGDLGGVPLMPISSKRMRAAFEGIEEVGTYGHTIYFHVVVPQLGDLLSSFYASRLGINGFRLTATLTKRHPGFLFAGVETLTSRLISHDGEALLSIPEPLKSTPLTAVASSQYSGHSLSKTAGSNGSPVVVDEDEVYYADAWAVQLEVQDSEDLFADVNADTFSVETPDVGVDAEHDALFEAAVLVRYASLVEQQEWVEAAASVALPTQPVVDSIGTPPVVTMPTVKEMFTEQRAHPAINHWIDYLANGEWSDTWQVLCGEDQAQLVKDVAPYFLDEQGLLRIRHNGGKELIRCPSFTPRTSHPSISRSNGTFWCGQDGKVNIGAILLDQHASGSCRSHSTLSPLPTCQIAKPSSR